MTESASEVPAQGGNTIIKNKALAFFYLFSIVVLTFCLCYNLRFIEALYQCRVLSIIG